MAKNGLVGFGQIWLVIVHGIVCGNLLWFGMVCQMRL